MKTHLYSYIVGNHVPVFIGLKHVTWYLNSNLHHPIMYPCGANLAEMNLLRCMYGNEQYDKKIMCNGIELFIDSNHACDGLYPKMSYSI